MRMKKTNDDNLVGNAAANECYDETAEEQEDENGVGEGGGGVNDRRPRCDYCLLTAECNCDGNREELLVCKDCNAKAHPSCMDYSGDLAMRSRMSPWQCIDCKTCYVCEDPGDADAMLFCDACDKGYHMECHDPKVPEKPNGKWVCRRCQEEGISEMMLDNEVASSHSSGSEDADVDDERHRVTNGSYNNGRRHHSESNTKLTVDGTPGLPTPCDSPVPDSLHSKSPYSSQFINYRHCVYDDKENDIQMMNVPDATDWSIDDVEKYFSNAGFPDQAKAFREQEIDGRSLLLMKRNDVLTGLSIKLGPALKIYNYVRRLQLKNVDDSNNGS